MACKDIKTARKLVSDWMGKENNFDPDEDWVRGVTEKTKSKKPRYNDKGKEVPEVCPKCGSEIAIYLHGEPVYRCVNKKCMKYFGVVQFKESVTDLLLSIYEAEMNGVVTMDERENLISYMQKKMNE